MNKKNQIMEVDEIFVSINGETSHSGSPTIFVRLFGCNVHCVYCDTPQRKSPSEMYIEDIIKKVTELSNKYGVYDVCITGGEPLRQESIYDLAEMLVEAGHTVYIETNGLIFIKQVPNRNYHFIMDIKVPSAGLGDVSYITHQNLLNLKEGDEVKIVFGNEADVMYAFYILRGICKLREETRLSFPIYLSPLYGTSNSILRRVIDWVVETPLITFIDKTNIHFQTQLHKVFDVK